MMRREETVMSILGAILGILVGVLLVYLRGVN